MNPVPGLNESEEFYFDEVDEARVPTEYTGEDQTVRNIGPEELITRLAPMHSISVGDIIEDEQGVKVIVDSFGFKEIQ